MNHNRKSFLHSIRVFAVIFCLLLAASCCYESCPGCTTLRHSDCSCQVQKDKIKNCAHGTYEPKACRCDCETGWGGELCDSSLTPAISDNYMTAALHPLQETSYDFSADVVTVRYTDVQGGDDTLFITGTKTNGGSLHFEIYTDLGKLKAPTQFHIDNPQATGKAWCVYSDPARTGKTYVAYKLNNDQLYIDEFTLNPLHIKGRFAHAVRDYADTWQTINITAGSFRYE